MSKNTTSNILIIISIIVITFGAIIALADGIVPAPSGSQSPKSVVACDVTINNQPLGTATIGNYQCRIERQCLFGFSVVPFGIVGQTGDVRIITSDATISKPYDTGFIPGTVTKSLSVCTQQRSGKIQITDSQSNIIDTKQWSV